jgi:hypothetical protein
MGRKLFSWTMGSDKLKRLINDFTSPILTFSINFAAWKKPTVRDFSTSIFDIFDIFGPYSDLWKNRPHKKHCAWARTPPWEFYWNLSIFAFFSEKWACNTAGKTVTKVGIYALPPLKTDFYSAFNNSRLNFIPRLNIYNSRPNLIPNHF